MAFLPPEPSGREPDLGQRQPPPPPTEAGRQPPQAPQQQAWTAPPKPEGPDNGSAIAGFTLSLIAGSLLLITAGLSSVISIVCAALGVFYSRRGKQRVDRGETPKHRGLAQAGFVIGLVSLGLAVLATLLYVAVLVLVLTNDDFQRDFEREFEREFDRGLDPASVGYRTALAAAQVVRGAASLLS